MQTDDIITYDFLVQEYLREYSNIFDSKRWEPTDIKNISKDESLLLMYSTVEIEFPVNKTVEKVYCKIRHKGENNKYGVGSSTKSVVTCHRCGKKSHLKRNCKSNRNVSNGGFTRHQQESFQNGSPRSLCFRCRKSDNSHYEPQQKSLQMVYFLQ